MLGPAEAWSYRALELGNGGSGGRKLPFAGLRSHDCSIDPTMWAIEGNGSIDNPHGRKVCSVCQGDEGIGEYLDNVEQIPLICTSASSGSWH